MVLEVLNVQRVRAWTLMRRTCVQVFKFLFTVELNENFGFKIVYS